MIYLHNDKTVQILGYTPENASSQSLRDFTQRRWKGLLLNQSLSFNLIVVLQSKAQNTCLVSLLQLNVEM